MDKLPVERRETGIRLAAGPFRAAGPTEKGAGQGAESMRNIHVGWLRGLASLSSC